MAELPNVRLNLANRPENVLLVRELLTGLAETIELDLTDLNDIRTAVTEACNNVVLHAYDGEEGPLEVEVYGSPDKIEVVVRDHGSGIQPRIRPPEEMALGIGLTVIQALVRSVEFRDSEGSGTEVRMEFATPSKRALATLDEDKLLALPEIERSDLATTTGVAIAPSGLARKVLPRVLTVLAAQARFSTDRISDTQLLADALAAHAPQATGSQLSMAVSVAPRELELRVGPFDATGAQRLIVESDVDGLGPVIERLTDDHRVTAVGSSQLLTLRLTEQR